jgi:hypothetical protein
MPSSILVAITISLLASTVILAAPTPEQKKLLDVKLTIQGRPEHPTVYMTRADIELAKKNREQFAWAKKAADKIIKDADEWANKSDDDIRKLLPKPGACFAYGFSGCPICGGKIGGWWGTQGCATFDDPGHVKCDKGHRLPDDAHPDAGEGWTDKSGKKYYFVGAYNAFVIDTLLTDALKPLCNAYALTGDAKYGNKAAMLLDELARLYPTCDKGSWDYPSNPPSGRFNRPWYQVARTLISYTNFYDILMMGDALNSPSSVAGKTKRENIEQNMLLNGARYCYEQSLEHPSLTNGQADYIRGAMVVGVAMGIPEYIAWTVDGPYSIRNMIENNIDRDGQYYETSSLYSHHSQYLYMDIAEILKNYHDEAHTDGIKLVENPKFRALFTLPSARLQVLGRLPTLGDDAPDLKTETKTTLVSDTDFTDLEHLRALSTDSQQKEQLGRLLFTASESDLDKRRGEIKESDWLLFHAEPVASATQGDASVAPTGDAEIVHPLTGKKLSESDLINQRGLAIVRRGAGRDAHALTLRAGPTLNHGHFDELNLNLYAGGHQLNYDLGYGLGSTHTQVGWAHQTASHTTVLVNEKSQLQNGRAGGTVECFLSLPDVQLVRANDPACYSGEGVSEYRRTVAMIDVSPDASYVVDYFDVAGGSKHDYIFHGKGEEFSIDGISLGEKQPGSLAGEKIDWGAHIGIDGDVEGVTNKPYWNPPPGNGLGFLLNPRSSEASKTWSATWNVGDDENPAHLRLWMLPMEEMKVVAADAPGILPTMPRASYVLVRHAGESKNLQSHFAAVIDPYRKHPVVKSIRDAKSVVDAKTWPTAIAVELSDGRVDYILKGNGFARISTKDDKIESITLIGAESLSFKGASITLPSATYTGTIDRIDPATSTLYTKAPIADKHFAGQFISIGNPAYTHRSSYRIEKISREGDTTAIKLAPTTFIIGRGHLDQAPPDEKTLPNVVPLEYAKSVGRKASGFYNGKVLTSASNETRTKITDIPAPDGETIKVENSRGFKSGDDVVIHDIQPGDDFTIPCWMQTSRGDNWKPSGNVDARIDMK